MIHIPAFIVCLFASAPLLGATTVALQEEENKPAQTLADVARELDVNARLRIVRADSLSFRTTPPPAR